MCGFYFYSNQRNEPNGGKHGDLTAQHLPAGQAPEAEEHLLAAHPPSQLAQTQFSAGQAHEAQFPPQLAQVQLPEGQEHGAEVEVEHPPSHFAQAQSPVGQAQVVGTGH